MAATANWLSPGPDFPSDGSPEEQLGFALKRALLASPEHWPRPRFQFGHQRLELSAPAPGPADLESRMALIHCGVVLQFLKLLLKRYQRLGAVEIFPDLDQPWLAARVHAGGHGTVHPRERQLSAALTDENPLPQLPAGPVSDTIWDSLRREVYHDRGWVEFARSEDSRQRLCRFTRPGETVAADDLAADLRSRNTAPAPPGFSARFWPWRRANLPATPRAARIACTPAVMPPPPAMETLAVIKTKTDDKHGWLAAGQTLARLLLHTRLLGIVCTPVIEALQPAAVRAELRTSLGHKGFTQVLLHFAGTNETASRPATATQEAERLAWR